MPRKNLTKPLSAFEAAHLEFSERSHLITWFRELKLEDMKRLKKAYNKYQSRTPKI
jgi:hypothetical protein